LHPDIGTTLPHFLTEFVFFRCRKSKRNSTPHPTKGDRNVAPHPSISHGYHPYNGKVLPHVNRFPTQAKTFKEKEDGSSKSLFIVIISSVALFCIFIVVATVVFVRLLAQENVSSQSDAEKQQILMDTGTRPKVMKGVRRDT